MCLLLAACAAPQPPEPTKVDGRIVPSETGLSVEGTGLEVGFGRAYDGAVAAVSKIEGQPVSRAAGLPDCGDVTWKSGLIMNFTNGSFTGWVMGGKAGGDFCVTAP